MVLFFTGKNVVVSGQTSSAITLRYCQDEALTNYPSAKDKALIKTAWELRLSSLQSGYLPQVSLNGQATYQSDGINITLPLPTGSKSMSQAKDQYKATLDINQVIYDGGTIRYQRKLEESSSTADIQQVEVDLYKIKEQVNNAYFLLLSLQQNSKLLNVTLNEIKDHENLVSSSVQNGVLTPADLDVLKAEHLKVEQQLAEIDISRKSTLTILSILINKPVPDSARFELPVISEKDTSGSGRPEYKLFDVQSERLDDSRKLTGSQLMPKVYAFAQGGVGRPGLNMLSNNFESFYILGASFKWTLWDWNKNRKDRQVLDVQKQMIQDKRETFDKNLNIDLQNRLAAIEKLEEALKRDDQIVELRGRVTKTSASKLENGVITSTDYLADLNAETSAKINLETHKIQLIQAKANYLLAKGTNLQ
jgi:Outer membrane protein